MTRLPRPVNSIRRHAFAEVTVTLAHENNLNILKIYLHTKMDVPGEGFQNLEREQYITQIRFLLM